MAYYGIVVSLRFCESRLTISRPYRANIRVSSCEFASSRDDEGGRRQRGRRTSRRRRLRRRQRREETDIRRVEMGMVVASEGKHEGESEGRLVVGAERETERKRVSGREAERVRGREGERCLDEEAEVEEDNIDPLVVPPLLAQPTPSLYYPPSLRLRSDVCAHLRPLKTHGSPGHARVLSFSQEGP